MELNININNDVINEIINTIEYETNNKIYAALLYGSRVTGYARDDSDYDVISIVENLGYPLRYHYIKYPNKEIYISTLLVDKDAFEKDVLFATYGEFVIGRLLSPYVPIINKEYIESMEINYKMRVTREELKFLYDKYRELIFEFLIPYKYILLSRLKRRILTYPIVKYSYIKTYYGKFGLRNMTWAIDRFRIAIKYLSRDTPIEIIDDEYFKLKGGIKYLEKSILMWIRSLKSYIAHGLSARVNPKVVGEEVKAKVIRSMELLRSPNELEQPEILLKTRFSLFTPKPVSYKDIVRVLYGVDAHIRNIRRKGLLSPTYVISISRDGYVGDLVIKGFSWLWVFKWFLIQLWLLDIRRFAISPKRRILNEYLGLVNVSEIVDVHSPRPLLIDWGGKKLVIEYVPGPRLADLVRKGYSKELENLFYKYGKILANIHVYGYTIGDTKPQNIIITKNNNLAIIDFEQFSKGHNKCWDISLFLYYTFKFRFYYQNFEQLISKFIKGYFDGGGKAVDIKKAVSIRFMRPFLLLVPINMLFRIRKVVLKNLS